ncbi:DeoR/GlpR family DNA-binding transcription regulator [Moorella naiadis]|uniref:DeoR/GlpR family DNA-binding transcription regulator n=1 Tax=Moorella naiadis (nom. illeg.) TaxID=3093670 RepID=UPI003D9CA623
MLTQERHQTIVELVKKNKFIKTGDLAAALGVAEVTIRRDLRLLAERGILQKVYGGVTTVDDGGGIELPLSNRRAEHQAEKRAIGRAAMELIADDTAIALDAGTTTIELARLLPARKNLTVVTHSLDIALELMDNPNLNLILTGGVVRSRTHALIGPLAEGALARFKVQKSFVAVSGIDLEGGLSVTNLLEIPLKQRLLAAGEEVIILADSSKIGKTSFAHLASLDQAHRLITDAGIHPEHRQQLEARGITITIAPPELLPAGGGWV